MSEEPNQFPVQEQPLPPEEIIVPENREQYSYTETEAEGVAEPDGEDRRHSPGLIGLAERIPGVNGPRNASILLLVVALAAIVITGFLLRGAFAAKQSEIVMPLS